MSRTIALKVRWNICKFLCVLCKITGTLSKPRWQRQRRRGETKDLIGRIVLSTCILKLCRFFSRLLPNKNVKSPKFTLSRNYLSLNLELNPVLIRGAAEVWVWRRKRQPTHPDIHEILTINLEITNMYFLEKKGGGSPSGKFFWSHSCVSLLTLINANFDPKLG